LKEYSKEQFIEVAVGLARQYLLMKDADRREAIAEEIATKLYDKDVKDVRQLIDVMKLYSIQKGSKTVDQVFAFREAYS
jgi:thioredoxin-like negative regulator of GroEL